MNKIEDMFNKLKKEDKTMALNNLNQTKPSNI